MKKASIQSLLIIPALALPLIAEAGSVRVYNADSSSYGIELNCQGRSKTLVISASRTSTYTFDSNASECRILGGDVRFPQTTLKNGESWTIRSAQAKRS